jgi:putative copper export protein
VIGLSWEHVRLFLHVLAAAIWVGGQFTLAGLVPALRGLGPDAPGVVARRFARVAWPAFAVLVVTGFWNVGAVHLSDRPGSYKATLAVKLVVVVASGVGAFLHQRARSRAGLAVWGALSALAALGSLLLGVMLHG